MLYMVVFIAATLAYGPPVVHTLFYKSITVLYITLYCFAGSRKDVTEMMRTGEYITVYNLLCVTASYIIVVWFTFMSDKIPFSFQDEIAEWFTSYLSHLLCQHTHQNHVSLWVYSKPIVLQNLTKMIDKNVPVTFVKLKTKNRTHKW